MDEFEILGWHSQSEALSLWKNSKDNGRELLFFELGHGFTSQLSLLEKKRTGAYLVFSLNGVPSEEKRLLQDARDGHWDELNMVEATLIAEGCGRKNREECLRLYSCYANELRSLASSCYDSKSRTRMVFEYMHHRILTGAYDLNLSSLAASFERGVFNCVSATILFSALAEEVGLRVSGLETTGHAKSRVYYEKEYLDIETTCTQWNLLPDRFVRFDGGKEESGPRRYSVARPMNGRSDRRGVLPDTEGKLPDLSQGLVSLSSRISGGKSSNMDSNWVWSGKRRMRSINVVQLIATIYYNRGVDHYQERRYNSALAAYAKALQLDPGNETVFGNFKATMNNQAIRFAMEKDFSEAIRLTKMGLLLDPDFEQFRLNLPIFYEHWIADLEKNGHHEEARLLRKNIPSGDLPVTVETN